MTIKKVRHDKGIVLKPDNTALEGIEGELKVDSADGKLKATLGAASREVVTDSQTQTLTNKTIDADNSTISNLEVDNLKAGVLNTSTSLAAASDTQVPSALAVKTYVDNGLSAQNEASEIVSAPTGTIAATNVQDAITELDSDIQGHINNATSAHAASAIAVTPSGNLSSINAQAALVELQGDIDTNASNLSSHTGATSGVHGVTGNVVGTSDAQTLTNKTVVVASNTITTAASGNLTSTELNAALSELQSDVDTRALDSSLTAHTGATSGVHGVTGNVVGTTDTQTLTNKTLTGASIQQPIRSDVKQDTKANLETYALTASNGQLVFATDSKEMFQVVDNALVAVGAAAGDADPDALLIQTFDSAALSDFTQTGLILDEIAPLNGVQSAKLIHQAGINQSFKQTIAVPPKFRGNSMTVALAAKSTASSGNVTILFRDETNALDLQPSQQIIATSEIQTFQFGVTIPANCLSFSYTITALPQSGSPETVIDDLVIRDYWMGSSHQGQSSYSFEVPASTDWTPATFSTLAWSGLGTVTQTLEMRRDGSDLLLRGKFVTGTTSGAELQIPLPLWQGVQLSTADSSKIPSIEVAGHAYRNAASTGTHFTVLIEPSRTYVNFSPVIISGANSPLSKALGSNDYNSGETGGFEARIPIAGWTDKETKSVVVNEIVPAKALNGNASFETANVTAWQSYTPTFQGFGTPSAVEFQWRQNGENVDIRGKFTSGTPTAVEARVGLPGGLTSAGTSIIPSVRVTGYAARSTSSSQHFATLVAPSVQYVNFGGNNGGTSGTVPANGTAIVGAGETLSFFASVPCAGLSATSTKTIGLTQSVLVEQGDLYVQAAGNAGQTVTVSVTDIPFIEIADSDGAWNGSQFTVPEDGIYDFSGSAFFTGSVASRIYLYINGVQSRMVSDSNSTDTVLPFNYNNYLTAGQVISFRTADTRTLSNNSLFHYLNITRAKGLKKLNVSSDQKIAIPTSELRFEGASSRGAVATAIVKFDTLAKIRGDAFTVVNTANDGTYVQMKKAGRLSVATSIYSTSSVVLTSITRNQANLTGTGTSSEVLAFQYASTANDSSSLSWTGDIAVGDIIRVASNFSPAGVTGNSFNLSFQEQEVQVSVSNTLPQFSESDSSVRVDTANGYGSTGTVIRRFSNVRENLGGDIEYVSSSVNGDSFVVKSPGIYNISYTDNFTTTAYLGLSKNVASPTLSMLSIPAENRLAMSFTSVANADECVSWQGYLNTGDIIHARTSGVAAQTSSNVTFTISKVGKPNVTGVDVTPFVNIPQPDKGYIYHYGAATSLLDRNLDIRFNTSLFTFGGSTDFISIQDNPASTRTDFVVLKRCQASIQIRCRVDAANNFPYIVRNGAVISRGNDVHVGTAGSQALWFGELFPGDVLQLATTANVSNDANPVEVQFSLEAASDQILTEPETFSTDTANLVYAPSSTYTLSTLANAPVGTFITFTYAASTNTRTQTTTAPTQTTADMNVNGIQIFGRAYNAASTAGQPSTIAIQIGKGLKGKSLELYKSTGKVTAGSLDYYLRANDSTARGVALKEYNEVTGILYVDAGFQASSAVVAFDFLYSDASGVSNGYLVINASKNPALTGLGVSRVAAAGINTAGTSCANGAFTLIPLDSAKTYDTHNALNTGTGTFTAPESGYYQVSFGAGTTGSIAASGDWSAFIYKNGAAFRSGTRIASASAGTINIVSTGSNNVYLAKGDTIQLYVLNGTGSAKTLLVSTLYNFLEIVKTSGIN